MTTHEHAVLRLARAADEGPGRLRAQGHRPRPLGRRGPVRRRRAVRLREPLPGAAQGLARSTTGSRSPRSAATTSSRTCGSPASGSPTCAATPTTAATSPAAGWPTPTPRRSARSSPAAARSPTRSSSSSPRSATPPSDDQIYRLTYDGQVADEHGFAVMGGAADVVAGYLSERYVEGASLDEARRAGRGRARPLHRRAGRADDRVIPAKDLEVAVLDRTRAQPRKFVRIGPFRLEALLGDRGPPHRPRWTRPAEPTPPARPPPTRSPDDPRRPDRPGQRRRPAARRPGRAPETARRADPRPSRPAPVVSAGVDRRIFGIENEYGVTCTFKGQRRLIPGRGRPLPVPQGGAAGAAAATSSSATAPGSTSTSAATRSTPPPSATTSSSWSPTTRRGSGCSRGCSLDAEQRLHDEGIAGEIYLFKNNTDSRRQLLRLPRELPGRPARRVQPARRRADPVPGDPADHRAAPARSPRPRAGRRTA